MNIFNNIRGLKDDPRIVKKDFFEGGKRVSIGFTIQDLLEVRPIKGRYEVNNLKEGYTNTLSGKELVKLLKTI